MLRSCLFAVLAAAAVALPPASFAGSARAAEPGFAGLQIQPADHATRLALGATDIGGGVLVRDIAPGGPGEAAGLRRGDLLLSYEGVALSGLTQLVAFMQGTRPNTSVSFTVRREGSERVVSLPLSDWPKGWRVDTAATALSPGFGTTTTALTQQVRDGAGVRWGRVGVLVAKVEPGSPADTGGLKAGDLLVAVGRTIIERPEDVETQVAAAGPRWMALVERGASVLLVGPGAPPDKDVVAGETVLAARAADGAFVLDVEIGAPAGVRPATPMKSLPKPAARPAPAEKALPGAGLRAATLSEQARQRWPVRWSAQGAVVVAVEPGSRASLAGLRPGHVIRSLNQVPVKGLEDLAPLDDPEATVMAVTEDLAGFTILTVEPKGGLPQAAPVQRPLLQFGAPKGG